MSAQTPAAKAILVVSTDYGAGLTSAVLGLYRALERQGMRVVVHKPILQYSSDARPTDDSYELLRRHSRQTELETPVTPVSPDELQHAVDSHKLDELMENLIQHYEAIARGAELVIMQGLVDADTTPYADEVNRKLAAALGADVVVVSSARCALSRLESRLDYTANGFGGYEKGHLLGAIINHVGGENALSAEEIAASNRFNDHFRLLGAIPQNAEIAAPRVADLQRHLGAQIVLPGDLAERRIHEYVMFARTVPHAVQFLKPNHCIFSPADRDDTLMAVTIAAQTGQRLACLVLTGPTRPSEGVMHLCEQALIDAQLPVLHIDASSWQTTRLMEGFNQHIPADDTTRIEKIKDFFAEHIKSDWVNAYLAAARSDDLSPAAFRYQIVQRAITAQKTIVLPEGDEPRTVVAAAQCAERGLAKCVLLAKPEAVQRVAAQQGVALPLHPNVVIVDPDEVRSRYIDRLVELRRHKGMNETMARTQLEDNVMLGTMMLEADEVDGLVSGAVHTTANTMRPPLQIIKTAPGAKMVSSVFFMCLPDQVLVYGDCAIVPNPDESELAQIAIQSHDTARAFGIDPKVAMISYSTGSSGTGQDVEKVKAATAKVREWRPDIAVDGPLQYDAAAIASVAQSKAPNSPVAGQASVFVFPDLNTGNTTYKAVQRSAHAVSMGPVLQGMRKPVNDLSRGALIEDIVYTIAITAVQASQHES